VRLSRLDMPRPSPGIGEETSTDNLSRGGARVKSRLALAKGEVLLFEDARGAFRTRAQIQEVTGNAHDQRLHLRFLDGFAPDGLIERAVP
jgi:hypothetical protein